MNQTSWVWEVGARGLGLLPTPPIGLLLWVGSGWLGLSLWDIETLFWGTGRQRPVGGQAREVIRGHVPTLLYSSGWPAFLPRVSLTSTLRLAGTLHPVHPWGQAQAGGKGKLRHPVRVHDLPQASPCGAGADLGAEPRCPESP